ncbi:hypothetical protein O3M35_000236 [Rhynocoris fuscipes]|uniref:Uncharacterized protein n=1 Tax=Rhynocoris fuscipes TaxID=488301 RepID=A0AAW1DLW8_9HEMI
MKATLIILSLGLLLITWSTAAPQGDVPIAENDNVAKTDDNTSISDKPTDTPNPPDNQAKPDETTEPSSPKTDETTEPSSPKTDETSTDQQPPVTPAPEKPSTTDDSTQTDKDKSDNKVDWLKKGAEKLNDLIKSETDIAKGTVDVIGSGMKMGTQISTAAGDVGTKLGQATLLGTLHLGKLGIDASSEMGKKLMDIMKKWGNIMPGPVGKGVQSVANLGDKGIDQLQGISKQVLGKFGLLGNEGLQWINGLIHKSGDTTNKIVEKGTGKIHDFINNREKQATDIINSILKG